MSASPSRLVLDAFAAGETSLAGVAARTGLPSDLVALIVDELVRLGLLQREALSSGCPQTGGCGGCPSSTPCPSGAAGGRGPVLVTVRLSR